MGPRKVLTRNSAALHNHIKVDFLHLKGAAPFDDTVGKMCSDGCIAIVRVLQRLQDSCT